MKNNCCAEKSDNRPGKRGPGYPASCHAVNAALIPIASAMLFPTVLFPSSGTPGASSYLLYASWKQAYKI